MCSTMVQTVQNTRKESLSAHTWNVTYVTHVPNIAQQKNCSFMVVHAASHWPVAAGSDMLCKWELAGPDDTSY